MLTTIGIQTQQIQRDGPLADQDSISLAPPNELSKDSGDRRCRQQRLRLFPLCLEGRVRCVRGVCGPYGFDGVDKDTGALAFYGDGIRTADQSKYLGKCGGFKGCGAVR